jgi:hypothetical protein
MMGRNSARQPKLARLRKIKLYPRVRQKLLIQRRRLLTLRKVKETRKNWMLSSRKWPLSSDQVRRAK